MARFNLAEPDDPAPQSDNEAVNDVLEWVHHSVGKMLTVVQDGKTNASDHTDWGYLNEIQSLGRRIQNVTTMALSKRTSGVGL
jgi:hypothetical protein